MANKKKWFWKIAKGLGAFVGVSGIIAIINFYIQKNDRADQNYQAAISKWQKDVEDWNNWSPKPLVSGEYIFDATALDLDTGDRHYNHNNPKMDLYYAGGDFNMNSYFRALHGTKWFNKGPIEMKNIAYRQLKVSNFKAVKHPQSKYYDLFNEHPSNSPISGYTYFIKTNEGNLSIVQIKKFTNKISPDDHLNRKMTVSFNTYPNSNGPPKPVRPVKGD